MITMSPARSFGAKRPATQPTNRSAFRRVPVRAQRQPAIRPNRSDHRQVVPPIHRSWVDQDLTPLDPRVRAAHREVGARFINKYEALGIYLRDPLSECLAFGLDVGAVLLCRPRPCFLKT